MPSLLFSWCRPFPMGVKRSGREAGWPLTSVYTSVSHTPSCRAPSGSTVYTVPLCDPLFMSRTTETSLTVSAFFEVLNSICLPDCWLPFVAPKRIGSNLVTKDPNFKTKPDHGAGIVTARCTTKAGSSQTLRHLFSFKCLMLYSQRAGLTASSGQYIKFRTFEGTLSCKLLRNDSEDNLRSLVHITARCDGQRHAVFSSPTHLLRQVFKRFISQLSCNCQLSSSSTICVPSFIWFSHSHFTWRSH